MNTQPHNSMIPEAVETPLGVQEGMTREAAEVTINRPYDPGDWIGVLNLSSAAYILGFDAMAQELAEDAIRLNPVAPCFINHAVILGSRGRFVDAAASATMAYLADKNNRTAATLYAETLLRMGKWREGWPLFHNYYDARRVSLFRHAIPEWTGQPLKGKRLLLIEGGGFGDNFFFLRWAKELKQRGAHITYLCPEEMASLMSGQFYIDRVIPTSKGQVGEIRPREFDYFVPLLALGKILDATVEYPQWDGQPWIGSAGGDELNLGRPKRVGICWQAQEACLPRPFRYLPRHEQALMQHALRDFEIVSLVYGDNSQIGDWRDTAWIMRGCDLVITVDTGVAHLAGAMQMPVWVLLPGFSAWYYLLGTTRHPLYPSMRLFRNHVRGIDISVAACVKALGAM